MLGQGRDILDFISGDSSYVSMLQGRNNEVNFYFRQKLKSYNFYGKTSPDGKNFEDMKEPVIRKSCASHNFSASYFPHLKKYIAIGGMDDWKRNKKWREIDDFEVFLEEFQKRFKKPYTRDEKRFKQLKKALRFPMSHCEGLYIFESGDGIHWECVTPKPIITTRHDGFISALEWGKSSDFDSMISLSYRKEEDLYYIYVRANIKQGQRYIQMSTSKDLKSWSKFQTIKTNPKFNAGFDEYYFPNVMRHPNLDLFFALMPYCCPKKQSIRLMTSKDGINWDIKKDFFEREPITIWKPKKKDNIYKNYHHPVLGYTYHESEKFLCFYILHNYMQFYKKKPVRITRHKLYEKDFNKLLGV